MLTYRGIPVLGPHSCIQQQRLGGPVPKPPESTALVGGGGEFVDEDGRDSAGASDSL